MARARLMWAVAAVLLCLGGVLTVLLLRGPFRTSWVAPWEGEPATELTLHEKEVRRLLRVMSEAWSGGALRRAHAARDELVEIMTDEDVPLLHAVMTQGNYRDLVTGPRGKTGLQPRVYVNRWKAARLEKRGTAGVFAAGALADYYMRTNSPRARDVFLDVLQEWDSAHVERMRLALLKSGQLGGPDVSWGTHIPKKRLLTETDWVEAVHRRYLAFERLESAIEASRYLFVVEKYRPEAVWFWCSILEDSQLATSEDSVKQVKFLLGYQRTPREDAIIMVFGKFLSLAATLADREIIADYLIPWAWHVRRTEGKQVWWFAHDAIDDRPPVLHEDVDPKDIPPGTPVPPQPDTVIEPKDFPLFSQWRIAADKQPAAQGF